MQRKYDATYKDEKTLSSRTICFNPNRNENYFDKSKYNKHLSEKHHFDIEATENNLKIYKTFFHGNKKKNVKTFYT